MIQVINSFLFLNAASAALHIISWLTASVDTWINIAGITEESDSVP